MAGSRLAKIGTIFARTSALLNKNVLSAGEKPIWFDIYALHPPFEEPRYDRTPKDVVIRDIFYKEDILRAKFHSEVLQRDTINLTDNKKESRTQKFIKIYDHLKQQGPLDDEKIFEVALNQLKSVKESQEPFMPAFAKDSRITRFKANQESDEVEAAEDMKQVPEKFEKKQPKESKKQKLENTIDVKNLF